MSIRVRVRLFALLRDRAGTGEVTLELPEGATCSDALDILFGQFPAMAGLGERVACAVGQEYVERSTLLRDGNELALIPPVSGG